MPTTDLTEESANSAFACTTEQTELGEGARWDARRAELLRVDILAGRVYRDRVRPDGALDPVGTYDVGGSVGAVSPIEGDQGWILASGQGFVHLSLNGSLRPIVDVAPAGTRMNDGACDPQGRLWAGTLADDHHEAGGALYRLDRDGHTEMVLRDLTISNGLGWSPDGATMYLVDSGPRVIYTFAFDGEHGTISGGQILTSVAERVGAPDGMTVDAGGDLWVAIYGAGRIHRYTPNGALRQVFAVPAEQTTSCAFAGPGLRWLYVTTGTEGWSREQRSAKPTAGVVYRLETDAMGQPAAPYRPDPDWWESIG
jgi:sugar lactone lactonase YvrE